MSPTTTTPAAGRQLQPTVLAATAVLFGVMTSHALLETARDALFLARLGPDRLAWAYLAIAGASLVAFVVMRRLLGLRDARRLLLVLVAIAAVGTSVLAATIALSHSLVFGLYVWTGLVATLVVPCFWTVVDRSLSVDQAKRYFSVIGAGGIGGALVGSAIATVLGRLVEPRHLVTAGAVSFTLTAVTAALLAPKPGTDAPVARKRADRGAMPRRTYRYIRLLVTTTLVATVALTLGDLAFKRAIAERLPAADLATTFGAIYTGLNILSLAVQLVLAPRILDRLGVGVAMVILPSLMLITTLGFAATAMLGAVLALKLGDGSLRHSLHRVTAEILYLPVAPGIRDGAKPIADALGQRGGQIVAVLVVLAATSIGSLDVGARFLAIVAAAATVVWLGLLPLVRAAYVDQFRAMLVAGGVQRGVRLPRLDASAVELLHGKLASPDEVEALAALELLAGHHAPLPALVLYHPRPAVVRRALELVGGLARSDVAPAIAHLAG
ncbi:MAG: hypothetical protein K8M05_37380, partial [Deltaproteobacteria bacterium]|nr:hypothetical protein [Kofleriaceae bacterium]